MKNKIIIITLFTGCFLAFTSLQAQISIIPKAGVTFSRLYEAVDFEDDDGLSQTIGGKVASDFKFGYIAGIGMEFLVTDNFAIQPELTYIQKGAKGLLYPDAFLLIDDALDPEAFEQLSNLTFYTTINYLEIPVLAKFKFGSDIVKGYVLGGPSIAFALNAKKGRKKLDLREEFRLKLGDNEDFDYFKRVDVGVQGGLGIGVWLGSGELMLEGRFGLGLNNIDSRGEQEYRVNTNAIQVTLGYSIPLVY